MILNLKAREIEALDRLLDAYLVTEEDNPMEAELRSVAAKVRPLVTTDSLDPPDDQDSPK